MQSVEALLGAARSGDQSAYQALVEPHRRELRAHCYRMSGSLHDADDLVQDSLLRAWRNLGAFEGRSTLRTWLFKVATNACLDALEKRPARSLPESLGDPIVPGAPMSTTEDPVWLEPFPDSALDAATPEAQLDAKQSVALAFLTALQLLPPRQRAALILREVVGLSGQECAELLGMTVAATDSALQRARDTLGKRAQRAAEPAADPSSLREILQSYVRAWEQADVGALVSLLKEDAVLSMPPYSAWFRGRDHIGMALAAMVLTAEARGNSRLVPCQANGLSGFAEYRRAQAGAAFTPASVHLLTLKDGRIGAITAFLDATLFAKLGLPPQLD